MAGPTRVLRAVALMALLALSAVPTGTSGPVTNQRPHLLVNGPPPVVPESLAGCNPPGPPLSDCSPIFLNFNQSWDPDPQDPANFTWDLRWSYITPGCPALEPAGAYPVAASPPGGFLKVMTTDTPPAWMWGQFLIYASKNLPPQVDRCLYNVFVTLDDHHASPGFTPPYPYCCDYANITVTVTHTNQPPAFSTGAFRFGMALASSATFSKNLTVDMISNEGDTVLFAIPDATDDKEVVSAQTVLDLQPNNPSDPPHRIRVAMQKVQTTQGVDAGDPPGTPEISTWEGALPVDTPDLVEGTYDAWAQVFDGDGHNATYGIGNSTLQVDANDVLGPSPPLILLNRNEPASNLPTDCFTGGSDPHMVVPPAPRSRISLGLGKGDTLRPIIQATLGGGEDNPNQLLWKVTYQTCKETATGPAYGPEVPLEDPSQVFTGHTNLFYLSLDTLFQGDQDVALRAYDRTGGVNGTAFHLVTATDIPRFMVAFGDQVQRPPIVYQGIPFRMAVLVHDRIDAAVSLHVDPLGVQNLTTARDPSTPWVSVARVPALGSPSVTAVDLGDGRCGYAYDADGNGLLDTVFDPQAMRTLPLLATASAARTYNDYVIDANADGLIGRAEVRLPGRSGGGLARANQCVDPGQGSAMHAFMVANETQVFAYNLTSNLLGTGHYRLAIRDLVFNRYADPVDSFTYMYAGRPQSWTSTLTGAFETVRALLDARVRPLEVPKTPLLPGDPFWLNATIEQHGQGTPEPRSPLLVRVGEAGQFDKNGTAPCPAPSPFPRLTVVVRCTMVLPPEFSPLAGFYNRTLNAPPLGLPCPQSTDPIHVAVVCVQRPTVVQYGGHDLEPNLHVALPAGPHTLTVSAIPVSPSVNDTDLSNNVASTHGFEIYAGKVVQGTVDAFGNTTSGKEYYIRADATGRILAKNGAVAVDGNGTVTGQYDLMLVQNGTLRYTFSPDGGATTLWWDPGARHDVVKDRCSFGAGSTHDCTRPITVIPLSRKPKPSTSTKASPGLEPLLPLLAAVAAAAVGLRRKR